jgi:hypothetical protein
MGWLTGNKDNTVGRINFEPQQGTLIMRVPERRARFIEFEGATGTIDEETNQLTFFPRGPIWIQLDNIGAYYDHTILLFGNKIRVMETAAQIAVKIMEAMK